ncbi:hypothetical protein ACS0TY_032218 [Phlomoides rotata]
MLNLNPSKEDQWRWTESSKGIYKASKKYWKLEAAEPPEVSDAASTLCFKRLWESWAPRKAISTTWRLLKDRLATKSNLCRRGVNFAGKFIYCVFCNSEEKNVVHLFFSVNLYFISGVAFIIGWVSSWPLIMTRLHTSFITLNFWKGVISLNLVHQSGLQSSGNYGT